METIITRDTDILREYLAVLDSHTRELSPFARLAATIKLAYLRRELNGVQLETTDEDLTSLSREVDDRLSRSWARRFEARPWGARIAIFVMSVLGQQLPLALVLLVTLLFVQVAPRPKWWNPVLPYEEPVFLWIYLFVFFCAAPLLALAVLFGGRYFRSWRATIPATLAIVVLGVGGTILVLRGKANPVQRSSSLAQFCRERGTTLASYSQWLEGNWLMKDAKFQEDYERFLRSGPGRWITSRFDASDDAAWNDSLGYMGEYLDGGQDPNSFREWLKYYLDKNRIYSEERIEQEVNALTGDATDRFLGIWQVEPYLEERDERTYRAYLGSVNRSTKLWGLLALAIASMAFLAVFFIRRAHSAWERLASRFRTRRRPEGISSLTEVTPLRERNYSFPEQREIATPPFFDTPFRILSRVHRHFVGRAIFTSIFVFAFWAVVYAIDLSSGNENVASQVDLMKNYLLVSGPPSTGQQTSADLDQPVVQESANVTGAAKREPTPAEAILLRIAELERRLDDAEYEGSKKIKDQDRLIADQRREIDFLKNITSQLEPLPEQLTEIGSRVGSTESRADALSGEVAAAKVQAEGVEKKLTTQLTEVESKATRAADEAGKAEEQASVLATRAEALEKELDRRASQIEARTEELGERTASLKESGAKLDQLQQAALAGVVAGLKADVENLDARTRSAFYRFFYKGQARHEAESLRRRLSQMTAELAKLDAEHANSAVEQLEQLTAQLETIEKRIK